MAKHSEKVLLCLPQGAARKACQDAAGAAGLDLSKWIRQTLGEATGVPFPELKRGFAAITKKRRKEITKLRHPKP